MSTASPLPYVTGYPSLKVREEIKGTGPELWENLIQTWSVLVQYYLELPATNTISPSMRLFLESYVSEDSNTRSNSNDTLSDGEKTLRQGVFALLTKQDENNDNKYLVLDGLSYKGVWNFVNCFGSSNATAVKKAIVHLYIARGGKAFVNQLIEVVIENLKVSSPPQQGSIAQTLCIVLTAGPGIAKDWVTVKWFSALQQLYLDSTTSSKNGVSGSEHQAILLQVCSASFCVPSLAFLDSNHKIKVLSDVISKATSSPQKHSQLLSALLTHTNFSSLIGVPSLAVSLETAKLRIPAVPSPSGGAHNSSNKKTHNQSNDSRNKGKTVAAPAPLEMSDDVEAVSMILDLFPQLSGPAVSALLASHGGSAEVVTSFLLENPDQLESYTSFVPPTPTPAPAPVAPSVSTPASTTNKNAKGKSAVSRSIYDDDDLSTLKADTSRLIFGKKEKLSFKSLGKAYKEGDQDKTLQATLQRIYQADEDEHDDTYDEAEVSHPTSMPTLTDETDVSVAKDAVNRTNKRNTNRRVLDDDETEDQQLSQTRNKSEVGGGQSQTDAIEQLLWARYNRSASEFGISARRTRARTELRQQTGWTDEQIEGWARMLERMPKRKALLEDKFMFAPRGGSNNNNTLKRTAYRKTNETSDDEDNSDEHPDEGQSTGGQQQRRQPSNNNNNKGKANSNNNSNANNRRKQGSSTSTSNSTSNSNSNAPANTNTKSQAQIHQRKEKNKARHGNHNRKAGHDKKMERAGAMPS